MCLCCEVTGLGQLGLFLSHRTAFEFELVSVVHEAIGDSIGEGRIAEDFVPFLNRYLASQNQEIPRLCRGGHQQFDNSGSPMKNFPT